MNHILKNFRNRIHEEGFAAAARTFCRAVIWSLCHRFTKKPLIKRRIHGYRMWLSLREPGISETLYVNGTREPEHLYILERVLKPGDCVLDIGGNIGYYALFAGSRVGESGMVYTVEPIPENCRILRENIKLNRFENFVELTEGAISSENGDRAIQLSRHSNLHSFHESPDDEVTASLELLGDSITVRTWDLSDFLVGRRPPNLLRMDVEGHEVAILERLLHAAEQFEKLPSVLFETHSDRYDPSTNDIVPVLVKLSEIGYRATYVASNSEPANAFSARSHEPFEIVQAGGRTRGIYRDIPIEDLIEIITIPGQSRCVLISASGS